MKPCYYKGIVIQRVYSAFLEVSSTPFYYLKPLCSVRFCTSCTLRHTQKYNHTVSVQRTLKITYFLSCYATCLASSKFLGLLSKSSDCIMN